MAQPQTKIDETEVQALLKQGERRAAFESIVALFRDKIFHLCWSILANEAAAADTTQDVLVRVWKYLPNYNGSASLSTWIYTITRNACFSDLKRTTRRQAISLDAPESEGTLNSLRAPEESKGCEMDIEAMLSQLPPKYQQVLRLYYLEEKSYEETAELLGIPLGTVKTFLFRARKELAQKAAGACRVKQLEVL